MRGAALSELVLAITLSLLAHAVLVAMRAQGEKRPACESGHIAQSVVDQRWLQLRLTWVACQTIAQVQPRCRRRCGGPMRVRAIARVEAFDSGFLENPVHPPELTMGPGVLGLGQTVSDAMHLADPTEVVQEGVRSQWRLLNGIPSSASTVCSA